ncbi:hypothetical protein L9F63_007927, partial [Diploptera punctata]
EGVVLNVILYVLLSSLYFNLGPMETFIKVMNSSEIRRKNLPGFISRINLRYHMFL